MKIYLPQRLGFCFGVKKAIMMVEKELETRNENVYCLGELIHNPQVMKELKEKGLKVIGSIEEVEKGILFTRAHGINHKILEEGLKKKLKVIETTCPYVLRLQKIAQKLAAQSYYIVIVGCAEHPEIIAVVSNTSTERLIVIKNAEEIGKIPQVKKVGVLVQTTESLDNFKNIVNNLIESHFEVRVFNTICKVVRERQKEAQELAKKVDAMIVVGGLQSSNTRKLAELCRQMGPKTFLVEDENQLNIEEIKPFEKIGITGGTSTPEKIINNVRKKLLKI